MRLLPRQHPPRCFLESTATKVRVRPTVSVERRGVSFVGTATSNRPFRSSFTSKGAGVMVMAPFSQRTSSGIPGFILDSRRIFLGITNRPALSMVVFIDTRLFHVKRFVRDKCCVLLSQPARDRIPSARRA